MKTAFIQGNQACAEGALAAGCRFFAGYPITPSSEIPEFLSRHLPRLGGVFIQMEDEIASIAAVIGASVGGLKAMTATSGPGFSLMQENIGYAAMTEIPCVIVDVQRAGPSTGLPTSPAQGDVMQARWGTHGDHPIIVLCPWSVQETFELTVQAFNFSEKYRTPVILLTDEVVAHMRERVALPEPTEIEVVDRLRPQVPAEWYFPYEEASADVPALANFGEGFRYHVTGLHHDRAGFPTERPDEIAPWVERVFGKIERNRADICLYEQESVNSAHTLVVAYGATARSAYRAIKIAQEHRRKVGIFRPKTLWPFPEIALERAVAALAPGGAHRVIVPEMNLGQLALEVERIVGRARVRRVNRADGQMITPEEILVAIQED
jgi:2-oxoglutarate ferredoxin oxidoreductase subunit alpha